MGFAVVRECVVSLIVLGSFLVVFVVVIGGFFVSLSFFFCFILCPLSHILVTPLLGIFIDDLDEDGMLLSVSSQMAPS